MSWTWNGVTPIVYTHWHAGEPNDGDGRENGSDQCGRFQTDGGWGDIVCAAPYSFFCERPQQAAGSSVHTPGGLVHVWIKRRIRRRHRATHRMWPGRRGHPQR
jgi:hypothetical protein